LKLKGRRPFFYLIGSDHKKASFGELEELHRQRKSLIEFWERLAPGQSAVLATCNRIEIYAVAYSLYEAQRNAGIFFKSFPSFQRVAYLTYGYQGVFMHAMRLACGIESQLKGEPQITQQLETWHKGDRLPFDLRDLIGQALYEGKEIRRLSGLQALEINIATVVYAEIRRRLGELSRYDAVILGTGKIAELFSEYCPSNARLFFAANKNFSKAKMLAHKAGGSAIQLKEVVKVGPKMDVLIAATSSPHVILSAGDIAAIAGARTRPLYIYDLAIPRDIEPKSGELNGVILRDLDALRYLFEEHNSRIADKIDLAEYLSRGRKMAQAEEVYA